MVFTEEMVAPLYDLLEPCKDVIGDTVWHPEGSVYVHSFQTVRHAIRETDSTDLIIASLMHDVGKSINRLGHDKESVSLIDDFVSEKTSWLVAQHMRVWDLLEGHMRKLNKVQHLLTHPWLPDLVALARWDKMGRKRDYFPYLEVLEMVDILNCKAEKHFQEYTHETNS